MVIGRSVPCNDRKIPSAKCQTRRSFITSLNNEVWITRTNINLFGKCKNGQDYETLPSYDNLVGYMYVLAKRKGGKKLPW